MGICRNLNEPYLSEKKPISKGYIAQCSIYITLLNDRSLEMENMSTVTRD